MFVASDIVTVTRVINPCALIEIGDDAVLTDPYFANHALFPMRESIGLTPEQLPPLRAILGGHGAFDHWQLSSLRGAVDQQATPVYCATAGMARRATRAGFERVEVLAAGDERTLSATMTVRCVLGANVFGSRTNHYLITTPAATVFVGTEARNVDEIQRFVRDHATRVDVAILPIDGLTFAHKRLVMDAARALQAAVLLGATTLIPIHYSQRSAFALVRCPSGIDELERLVNKQQALCPTLPAVQHAPPGIPNRVKIGVA